MKGNNGLLSVREGTAGGARGPGGLSRLLLFVRCSKGETPEGGRRGEGLAKESGDESQY